MSTGGGGVRDATYNAARHRRRPKRRRVRVGVYASRVLVDGGGYENGRLLLAATATVLHRGEVARREEVRRSVREIELGGRRKHRILSAGRYAKNGNTRKRDVGHPVILVQRQWDTTSGAGRMMG